MAERTKKEIAAPILLISFTSFVYILGASPHTFGMCMGQMWYTRFTYQFLHASVWHLAINSWVILTITHKYHIRIWQLISAYVISVPPLLLGHIPTIGLSGMCYALMGIIWCQVLNTWLYHGWIIGFILIGFLFPASNAWIHLYCYTIGSLIGLLNKPINYENGD